MPVVIRPHTIAIALVCLLSTSAYAQRRRSTPAPAAPGAASAPAPAPAPAASADAPAGKPKGKTKVFDFTGIDISGQNRSPQLLYFLERANEELERASLERRSFIPEMVKSIEEDKL